MLADCLADGGELGPALRRYEERRLKRTARVQRWSRRAADLMHLPDGPEIAPRDGLFGELYSELAWIHAFDAHAKVHRPPGPTLWMWARPMAEIVDLAGAVRELVRDGDAVAMEGFTHLIPFAAGHEVLRQGRRELDVFGIAPVEAANTALARAGIAWGDVEVVELNEAFAAQSLACLGEWDELDPERVNVNGGAIAIGHPLGASGARILGTLAYELRRRGGGYGVAAICIGVGQGLAMVLHA